MKITQLRDKEETTALTTMDIETWIEKTKTEIKARPVTVFREMLKYTLPDERCYGADKLPFYPLPISAGQKGGNK